MKTQDSLNYVDAYKIPPKLTQRKIENTKYMLFPIGSEVAKDQLIAYNIDSVEIAQLENLLHILGTYNNFNTLKTSLNNLEIKDKHIEKGITNIVSEISIPTIDHSKSTKPQYQTVKKVVNKEGLITLEVNDLADAQARYSRREIDLSTLKKYVEKVKSAKATPEFKIDVKKPVSITSKTVNKKNKSNERVQNMIYALTNEIQDKISISEIKSPAFGVLKLDSSAQYSVWVQDDETEIAFGLNLNNRIDSSVHIEITCTDNEVLKTQAIKQNAQSKFNYKFKISATEAKACISLNAKQVQVLLHNQSKSTLCELIELIRKSTCE